MEVSIKSIFENSFSFSFLFFLFFSLFKNYKDLSVVLFGVTQTEQFFVIESK